VGVPQSEPGTAHHRYPFVPASEIPLAVKRDRGGVFEIVKPFDKETYRAVYAVRVGENLYVLHAFQKKSKKGIATPKPDIELIKRRLKAVKDLEESDGKKRKV